MTIKLTKKQLLLLDYIEDFTRNNGHSPSYREIMAGLGLRSVSSVAEHIEHLVEKGIIVKKPGAARSLEVVDYRHEETTALFNHALTTASAEDQATLRAAAEILGLNLEN